VEYRVLGPLPAARAGQALFLRVAVRNSGALPWSHMGAHPVNLSYHWLDQNSQVVDFDGLRAVLPQPLCPGMEAELELQVEPPPHAGDYLLALDMVEEGVGWFSQQGIAPLTIRLTVAAAISSAPRVCIVNGNCMLNDALGNHVVNQLRFFQDRGYRVLALLEHVDERHPPELRQHLVRLTLDDLRAGPNNPQTRRGVTHFQSADLYVFNYSTYYPLIEAIRLVGHGLTIFDYHGVTPPELWGTHGATWQAEGQRQLQLARYADYAIAHSRFTRGELLRTGVIAAERIYQMPYVVPLERFRPGRRPRELAERYGLRDDQPVLLYVGRMAINKRIDMLVRALARIREHLPRAVLLLVGNYQIAHYIQVVAEARELAKALGVADGVIFTGQVPDEELPAHYQLADVFVTASVHEGFCIPVVEAMACGVPVVGARATALPETIGPAGLTFRPDDPADMANKILALLAEHIAPVQRPQEITNAAHVK